MDRSSKRHPEFFEALKRFPKESSWLDVGAGNGWLSDEIQKELTGSHERIDLEAHPNRVKAFSGELLGYPPGAFDLVVFSYVLHHAAEHAQQLLKDALSVARVAVIIQEDLRNGTEVVDALLNAHDPQGIFYSQEGWHEQVELAGGVVTHFEPLTQVQYPHYPVPRGLFLCGPG